MSGTVGGEGAVAAVHTCWLEGVHGGGGGGYGARSAATRWCGLVGVVFRAMGWCAGAVRAGGLCPTEPMIVGSER